MATKRKSISNQELIDKLEQLERENATLRNNPDNFVIRLDEYIEVMSLVPHKLNLSTDALGKGRKFSFSKFGEVKRILYNDLASVLENYYRFMEGGLFYILDERVVRKHGLDDIYAKILNKATIQKILECESPVVVKLYENATPHQRETIDGMLTQKLKNGEDLDLNIISKISKLADKDLVKLAEDARFLEGTPIAA